MGSLLRDISYGFAEKSCVDDSGLAVDGHPRRKPQAGFVAAMPQATLTSIAFQVTYITPSSQPGTIPTERTADQQRHVQFMEY